MLADLLAMFLQRLFKFSTKQTSLQDQSLMLRLSAGTNAQQTAKESEQSLAEPIGESYHAMKSLGSQKATMNQTMMKEQGKF